MSGRQLTLVGIHLRHTFTVGDARRRMAHVSRAHDAGRRSPDVMETIVKLNWAPALHRA
jgi:hypothetical protein